MMSLMAHDQEEMAIRREREKEEEIKKWDKMPVVRIRKREDDDSTSISRLQAD